MKILNINSYYYSSSVHNQLQNILNKHDINTYTYVPVYKGYIPRDECKFDNEENVYKSECFNRYDKFIFYLKHSKIFNDIKKHVKISDYSCLHAHSLFSNGYIAYKLYKKYHIPYVVTVRNTDINVFFKKAFFLRNLGRKIINNASQVIFLSNAYRDMLINQYVKVNKRQEVLNKSIVIPSGINDFWLDNKGTSKTYDKADELKLLYVGVINKNKNLYTTVKAIDVLVSKGMKVKYTVVGKISDEQAFNEIKDRPFVNYLPPRNKEELLNIYRENHLFVMPSVVETFGLVYPEALSQGLQLFIHVVRALMAK